jgi:hypothetical protein
MIINCRPFTAPDLTRDYLYRGYTMKRTMITLLLALMSVGTSGAVTYKWTDNHGVVSFADDPARIPFPSLRLVKGHHFDTGRNNINLRRTT